MIGFVGFGVLGRQLFKLSGLESRVRSIVAFDDLAESTEFVEVRPFSSLGDSINNFNELYVGIGYRHLSLRNAIVDMLKQHDSNAPPIIHNWCSIANTATVGACVYIYAGCVVDENVILHPGVILNNHVTVSHDSVIDMCTFLAPGVIVCGNVSIGSRSFVGAGSVIANGVTIGDDVVIGAGTVVSKNVASNTTVVGNPMRVLDSRLHIK